MLRLIEYFYLYLYFLAMFALLSPHARTPVVYRLLCNFVPRHTILARSFALFVYRRPLTWQLGTYIRILVVYGNEALKYWKVPVFFLARFSLSLSCVCVCVCKSAKTGYNILLVTIPWQLVIIPVLALITTFRQNLAFVEATCNIDLRVYKTLHNVHSTLKFIFCLFTDSICFVRPVCWLRWLLQSIHARAVVFSHLAHLQFVHLLLIRSSYHRNVSAFTHFIDLRSNIFRWSCARSSRPAPPLLYHEPCNTTERAVQTVDHLAVSQLTVHCTVKIELHSTNLDFNNYHQTFGLGHLRYLNGQIHVWYAMF